MSEEGKPNSYWRVIYDSFTLAPTPPTSQPPGMTLPESEGFRLKRKPLRLLLYSLLYVRLTHVRNWIRSQLSSGDLTGMAGRVLKTGLSQRESRPFFEE